MKNRAKKSKKKKAAPPPADVPNTKPVLTLLCLAGIVAGAVVGLEQLKQYVYSQPEYNPAISVDLDNPPAWVEQERWQPHILASVSVPSDCKWLDDELVKNIAGQLEASGWVSKVNSVVRDMNGRIGIDCEFRRPIAMIRTALPEDGYPNQEMYIAIDKDGVRLPEIFPQVSDESNWLQIVGVQTPPPRIGQPYLGDSDAVAAIRIACLIATQEFASDISRIDVSNYEGRISRRRNHIMLCCRDGKPAINWGSAIGQEIEEASPLEKIRNIALILRSGAQAGGADPSIYPDGILGRTIPATVTVNSSRTRG